MIKSGTCTQAEPGIPEQVVQHLRNIRLENLLAPRWSIVLNEHGCQLQVFWSAPKGEGRVGCASANENAKINTVNSTSAHVTSQQEPPTKKMRPEGAAIAFVNQSPTGGKAGAALGNVSIRQIGAQIMRQSQNALVPPKSPKTQKGQLGPIAVGLAHQPTGAPTQPQITVKTRYADNGVAQLGNGGTTTPQRQFQSTKIAQVSIPTRKENRKSIESTALMLMGQNVREFTQSSGNGNASSGGLATPFGASPGGTNTPGHGNAGQAEKLSSTSPGPALSPTGIVTPPSSERSSSGDGKEPDAEEKAALASQSAGNGVGMEFISDLYRQKFSCEICRKTFTRKYSLSRHYKEVHQGESRSNKFQSLGPSMVAGGGMGMGQSLPDARLLNDFGLPSMARLGAAAAAHAAASSYQSSAGSESDVKIEEYDEDDSAPSMVIKRQSSALEF